MQSNVLFSAEHVLLHSKMQSMLLIPSRVTFEHFLKIYQLLLNYPARGVKDKQTETKTKPPF